MKAVWKETAASKTNGKKPPDFPMLDEICQVPTSRPGRGKVKMYLNHRPRQTPLETEKRTPPGLALPLPVREKARLSRGRRAHLPCLVVGLGQSENNWSLRVSYCSCTHHFQRTACHCFSCAFIPPPFIFCPSFLLPPPPLAYRLFDQMQQLHMNKN